MHCKRVRISVMVYLLRKYLYVHTHISDGLLTLQVSLCSHNISDSLLTLQVSLCSHNLQQNFHFSTVIHVYGAAALKDG
jgi:hypothetical protein